MLRNIMAAIRAAFQFIARVIMIPVNIAGEVIMTLLRILERVFAPAQSAEEGAAVQQATQQAQATQESAERTMAAGDYSTNLRGLARRRADHKEIDEVLWQRVPGPLADYVRGLSLPECQALAKTDLKSIASFLEGKRERLDGVRTPAEVADAAVGVDPAGPTVTTPEEAPDRKADFKARLAAKIRERQAKPEPSRPALRIVA